MMENDRHSFSPLPILQPGVAMKMRWMACAVLALASTACTQTRVVQSDAAAAVAPQLAVESFLQAANARDLHGMGQIFGTVDGPLMEKQRRQDVELRMDAISSILKHDDYRIIREEMVAGRDDPTTRVIVDMTINGRSVDNVPFVVVRAKSGRWLVQEVDLERVMAGG